MRTLWLRLIFFWLICLGNLFAGQREDQALKHARKLLQTFPLIDGHNDLPWILRENEKAPGDAAIYDLRQKGKGDTDLVRLKEGLLGGQFWSVWIPANLKEGFAKIQLEQIDLVKRMIARYPENLEPALSASDIIGAFKRKKIASLIGIEGGHAIENSLGVLRCYYHLGVRYMTLTYNVTLDWADSVSDEPRNNGLTNFGKEVVREMNRLGMLVDLSHVSPKVMSDVLDISEAPVIFSHSSAAGLVDHPRNVPDIILKRLRKNGGIVMVAFIPYFVSRDTAAWDRAFRQYLKSVKPGKTFKSIFQEYKTKHPMPKASLSQVADHIEYIRNISGIDCVGIGSDFWGGGEMPVGLEDTSKFPYLFAELIKRGWNDADLRKLAGENILRVLREAEATARSLQKIRPASTAIIEKLDKKK